VELLTKVLEALAVIVIGRSFISDSTSIFMKYGSVLAFIADKFLLLIMKKKSNKNSTAKRSSASPKPTENYLFPPSTANLPEIFLSSPNC